MYVLQLASLVGLSVPLLKDAVIVRSLTHARNPLPQNETRPAGMQASRHGEGRAYGARPSEVNAMRLTYG